MKLSDLLKKLFGDKLDEEIDMEEEDTTPPKEDEQGNEEDEKGEEKDDQKEEEKTSEDEEEVTDGEEEVTPPVEEELDTPVYVDIYEDGWLSTVGGNICIDFKKIKNEEVKKMITFIQTMYDFKVELMAYIDGLSLTVSTDFLLQQLEFGDIDKSQGSNKEIIEKAINKLKEKEPGLFKADPLDEGFDPVNKSKTTTPNSFTEAFQLME